MTAQEIQKRNGKAQKLRVIQVDDENFYVESSEGKICYRVVICNDDISCTCGDFARNQKDPKFRCKHLLAVLACTTGDIQKAEILERKKPKLDERFIKRIEGQEFVTYRGLLDLAHQKGLLKMEVIPVQYPCAENNQFAICKAIAESSTGELFTDVGDASPMNCNAKVAKHVLRMASTRAKARALRDMTNIGMTCLEELEMADLMENAGHSMPASTPTPTTQTGTPANRGESRGRAAPARRANSTGRSAPPSSRQTRAPQQASEPVNTQGGEPDPAPTPSAPAPSVSAPSAVNSTRTASRTARSNQDTTANNGPPQESPRMSEAQRRAVYNLSRRRGITVEDMERMVQESYQIPLAELSSKDASQFIRQLQSAA